MLVIAGPTVLGEDPLSGHCPSAGPEPREAVAGAF